MEQLIYILITFLVGLLIGGTAIWLILRERISSVMEKAKGENQVEIARLNERLTASQEDVNRLTREKENLAALREQLTAEQQRLSTKVAELAATLESERSRTLENLQLLNNAKEQYSNHFKTLANDILEDKSKRFTEQNQTNLN